MNESPSMRSISVVEPIFTENFQKFFFESLTCRKDTQLRKCNWWNGKVGQMRDRKKSTELLLIRVYVQHVYTACTSQTTNHLVVNTVDDYYYYYYSYYSCHVSLFFFYFLRYVDHS